jgi:hypothetical protein
MDRLEGTVYDSETALADVVLAEVVVAEVVLATALAVFTAMAGLE